MKSRVIAVSIFALITSAFIGCGSPSRVSSTPPAGAKAELPQPPRQAGGEAALQVVDAKYVCMINNQRFSKVQIPVEVEGRTYYGCCEMCKGRLGGDPTSRVAVDPVSGKEVDKAGAVIGADADGAAFYFENAENLKRYKPAPKS
jgi:YHS domain-containing protein